MRRLLAGVMVVLAGLLTSAPQVVAETGGGASVARAVAGDPFLLLCMQPYPGPPGWRQAGYYDSCRECREDGDAGVRQGDWAEYRCVWFPAGLDIVYYLYIPPTPG